MPISFQAQIISGLSGLHKDLAKGRPDSRHNQGAALGEAFFWDIVADYAKKQSDRAWKGLEDEGVIPNDEKRREASPGDYNLAESPHFVCMSSVSQPVRRFNVDALATELKKKFKVPIPTTKELCEAAKKPTVPQVKLKIEERGSV